MAGEAQQRSEEDIELILKQLNLVQRERDAARKQLLKTDANLKRTEKCALDHIFVNFTNAEISLFFLI